MLTLTKAEPIGETDPQLCHLNMGSSPHRWEYKRLPIFDETRSRPLLEARVAARLTVREAAARTGLGLAEYSGLEHGRYTCSDADLDEVYQRLGLRT